jgi:hypothetical protein
MSKNRDVMETKRLVAMSAGLLVAGGVLAAPASAITPTVCQVPVNDLKLATFNARSSFANDADFIASFDKVLLVWPRVTGAVAPPDTWGILADYQGGLNSLAAASKLDPAVAKRLVDGAQAIIDCLNANIP